MFSLSCAGEAQPLHTALPATSFSTFPPLTPQEALGLHCRQWGGCAQRLAPWHGPLGPGVLPHIPAVTTASLALELPRLHWKGWVSQEEVSEE